MRLPIFIVSHPIVVGMLLVLQVLLLKLRPSSNGRVPLAEDHAGDNDDKDVLLESASSYTDSLGDKELKKDMDLLEKYEFNFNDE